MARGNILQPKGLLEIKDPLSMNWAVTDFVAYESVSAPFQFSLTMIVKINEVDLDALLGKDMTVCIHGQNTHRNFSGCVLNYELGEIVSDQLRVCKCTLIPWFWLLQYDRDYKVFQNKTIVQIFTTICKEKNFHDYDISNLKSSHKAIPYCVQHNESAFEFLSRSLKQAGIYYYFVSKNNKHIIMLCDKGYVPKQFNENVVYSNVNYKGDYVHEWNAQHKLHANQFTVNNYDYQAPATDLSSTSKTKAAKSQILGASDFELHEYPGYHQDKDAGKDMSDNIGYCCDADSKLYAGEGSYIDFIPGLAFQLNEHPDKNQNGKYYIRSIEHRASDKTHFLSDSNHSKNADNQSYTNKFICDSSVYQPDKIIHKPGISGIQTAIVSGESKGKLFTDKLGQVKNKYHWDRDKSEAFTDSSCWTRVKQQLGSVAWGMQLMPRAESEVIVSFVNSDPDRPLITGALHNADNLPPYQYPIDQVKTGIKTRSIGANANQSNNEIQFHDAKNAEYLNMHTTGLMSTSAKKSVTEEVTQKQTDKVSGKRNYDVGTEHVTGVKKQINIAAGKGSITFTPDHMLLQGNKISLGEPGS